MNNKEVSNIPFNRPYISGREISFISQAIENKYIAGGHGQFSKKCMSFFNNRYGFEHNLLTHSCSGALEIAATLCDLKAEDEVIVPSFAYVTTAAAFDKTKASLIFADSEANHPNVCPKSIRSLITKKTKVLVIVHYAGMPCQMDHIMKLVKEFQLILIEDCAHAIDSYYQDRILGSFGHLSTFSFHETKNIHCGEGGLLVINDKSRLRNALEIWQEGTDRSDFENGLKNKYEWVNTGSSYQPPELSTAFLYGQLQKLDSIQEIRKQLWNYYFNQFALIRKDCSNFELPVVNNNSHNSHIFYLKCANKEERNKFIKHMQANGIMAIFHYLPLHISPYQANKCKSKVNLINTINWSECIVRLPLYIELSREQQNKIISVAKEFFKEPCSVLSIS